MIIFYREVGNMVQCELVDGGRVIGRLEVLRSEFPWLKRNAFTGLVRFEEADILSPGPSLRKERT
jgi:hypothetical protein